MTLLRGTYSKDVELTLSDLLARSRPGAAPWPRGSPGRSAPRSTSASSRRRRSRCATTWRGSRARWTCARGGRSRTRCSLGQVILDEGGRVVFSDIRYEIEAGTLTFSNTARIAPFVDLRARAEVKGYNLVVLLAGTWPRITANFTSDPPLSNDAILGLILSGTAPDTRSPADTTNQLVSAAGGVDQRRGDRRRSRSRRSSSSSSTASRSIRCSRAAS